LDGEGVEGGAELLSLGRVESAGQVAPDGGRMDRPGGFGQAASGVGEPDLDAAVGPVARDQAALFHAGQLVVTGANKGNGQAIVAGLAQHGFTVYLGARDPGRGQAAAAGLATSGDVRAITLDVTSDGDFAAAVSRVEGEVGYLDVLVNNAGTHPLNHRWLDRRSRASRPAGP
jgi:short chain dehydrogenase